jgi:hypothetical protein
MNRIPIIFALLAAALTSCAKSEDPMQGSQTHFLAACEDSCAAPYACLCGVCTLECDADPVCSAESSSAQCLSGSDSCGTDEICDVECANDMECAALGSEHECEQGRCRAPMLVENGTSGSGGSGGGAGGSSGASGAAGTSGAGGTGGTGDNFLGDICDGSSDIRLGYTVQGGFVEPAYYVTNPYGHAFLFIDGECTYYASTSERPGVYFTGTLTLAQEQALTNDIEWDSILELAAVDDLQSCPDAGDSAIWVTGMQRVMCTCGCDEGPFAERKTAALTAISGITMELVENGFALNTPIRAVAADVGPATGEESAWPLDRAVSDVPMLVQDVYGGQLADAVVFDDPTEASALRELRSDLAVSFANVRVSDQSIAYELFMRDELPLGVEQTIDQFMLTP